MKVSLTLRIVATASMIPIASDSYAQGAASADLIEALPALLKAGAIGLAFFGLFLSYRLLADQVGPRRSKVHGYVFLGVVLVASCIFLWAELHKRHIEFFVTPVSYDANEAPKLSHNQKTLILENVPHTLQCDERGSLTVNLEALVKALNDAKFKAASQGDAIASAQAKTLAALSQVRPENQASIGFDVAAGEN